MTFLVMVSVAVLHEIFSKICCFFIAERKARYDKFGEEGLKGGVPTADQNFLEGYVFHGDAKKIFKDFFGGENPFSGACQIKFKLFLKLSYPQ